MQKPRISVVIPAFNEEGYLPKVLESLEMQTFNDFEVIVVDGASTDRTRDIAAKHGKVVIEKRKGIGLARNIGVAHAKGELLFFTNADTSLSPSVLDVYAKAFDKRELVAATGPLVPIEETTKFIRFWYKFASVWLAKLSFWLGRPAIAGSNFSVRKSAFEKVGGFDTSFDTYEDLDLTMRLRNAGEIAYINEAIVATSTRRIRKWGIPKYIYFNASNVLKYSLFKRAHKNYEYVR